MESVVYEMSPLLDQTQLHVQVKDCLFYYDGSIFLGEVEKKDMTPSRGSFYLLSNNGFIKTVIGESCSTCHVKDISLSGVYRSGIVKLQFTY